MENEDEIFDIVNEKNEVIGQEYRGIVHRTGLLHRAVYCWVFNSAGDLLLQKRSPLKKIGPSQWDLSLAEHLQPGESFEEAVRRGLKEELGINLASLPGESVRLVGPITSVHKRELHVGEFHDVELVQSFRLEGLDLNEDAITFEDGEVSAVQWTRPEEVKALAEKEPEKYTAWLVAEGTFVGWNAL